MLLNCGVWEDSWESLQQQEDQTSQSKEISPEYSLEGPMLELKLQYFGHLMQKTKITWNSITSWQVYGETVETVRGFIFLGSKITADGDCRHGNKRCLLLGRKAMTKLDSILKSRDITLPTKVHVVKAMAFQVVMYGDESWIIKKAECWRIDTFELRCWRRL